MNGQPEYYRAQAEAMRAEAAASNLANVRERYLRSAEAWDGMAERGERHRRSVAKTDAAKAAALQTGDA